MRHAEKLLEISEYEIFTFKVQGDLLGYCNLVQVGIYSSTPTLCKGNQFFTLERSEIY